MTSYHHDDSTGANRMRSAAPSCVPRHLYHMMPPQGWMNDPNGFVYFRGQYHLFYQYYPYATQWGLMHWGHCVSDDLVRWRHLPIALSPDQPYDDNGCFSGSSIVKDGKLCVFYTGNARDGRQRQCLAVSEDGIHFQKHPDNPIIGDPPDFIKQNQFRDPFVFRHHNRYFLLVGAEGKDHQGQALVYVSNDLLTWNFQHTIAAGTAPMGYMWECPSIAFFQNRAVLMFSPQGMTDHPQFDNSGDSGYFVGRFDPETCAYQHGAFHKLDYGFDFYAAQTTRDAAGRQLLTAWMRTWATPIPTEGCPWVGSLILPREMRLKNDRLHFTPVRELQAYLAPVTTVADVMFEELFALRGTACKLDILANHEDFTLHVFGSDDGSEYTALSYNAGQHAFCLDLSHSGQGVRETRGLTLPDAPETLRLSLYLDRTSVEVFINDGAYVMTARVFPAPSSDAIRFYGKALLKRLSLWAVKLPHA